MRLRITTIVAGVFIVVGCGGASDDETVADGGTTTSNESSGLVVEESTTTTAGTAVQESAEQEAVGSTTPGAAGIVPDADWEVLAETWFVYGVADDDVLNVRSEPGVDNEILTALSPGTTGLTRYSEVVFIGGDRWSPIVVFPDTTASGGWVNLDFLRPEPAVESPAILGVATVDPVVVDGVVEALADPVSLADFVGDRGLTLSPQEFVDGSTQQVTVAELEAPTDDLRVWGSEPGTGEVIESSLTDYLRLVAGSTAITSTEAIGHDVTIGSGNVIDNVADAFPGAAVIEYHFGGTQYYAGLDWESVRLVFDVSGADDVLLAVVSAAWAP